jgi:virulence-associated protein VapD
MYAISFDMEVAKLKEHYGEPYNKAYGQLPPAKARSL